MSRYYSADELGTMEKGKLEIIAEARDLQVTGTGSGGNIITDDLVSAISANQDRTGINPALAPEPVDDVERTYTVTAPSEVHGHQPGETFSMVIPAAQHDLLIRSGALVEAEKPATTSRASGPASTQKEGE